MSEIRDKVLSFVNKHDSNPANGKADPIDEKDVTGSLAAAYGKEVLSSLKAQDISAFHGANEILFESIPPSRRTFLLQAIANNCAAYSDSAVCENKKWEGLPPSKPSGLADDFKSWAQGIVDKNRREALEQVRDLDSIPTISQTVCPDIYQKLMWLIDVARRNGEKDFAEALKAALDAGKFLFLADLKIAQAYVDPRKPDHVIFGREFFENTWADKTNGLDGKPLRIKDQWILDHAEMLLGEDGKGLYGIRGPLTMQDLKRISWEVPGLSPLAMRKRLESSVPTEQRERFTKYFGNTAYTLFPPNMPVWIIMVAHEVRHTMQIDQDLKQWKPDWSRNSGLKGLTYYTTLIRFSSTIQHNDPSQGLSQSRGGMILKETKERMEAVSAKREREATQFGVRMAIKFKGDFQRSLKAKRN